MKEKKEENENNSFDGQIIQNEDNNDFDDVKSQENYDDESQEMANSNKKIKNKTGDFYWNFQIRDKKKQSKLNKYLHFPYN